MHLEVKWRRVWQVKQYETEEIELRLGGEYPELKTGVTPTERQTAAAQAARIEHQLLTELTAMGDQIMAERLSVPDVRRAAPPVPARPGRGGR